MFFSPLVFASNVPRPHEMLGEAQTEIWLRIPEELSETELGERRDAPHVNGTKEKDQKYGYSWASLSALDKHHTLFSKTSYLNSVAFLL